MRLRTRLLLAFAAVVFVPLGLLAFGLRQEMTTRLSEQYAGRLESTVQVINEDLHRESAAVDARLATIERAIAADGRFRADAVAGSRIVRGYVLDYAEGAMRSTGLSMLEILDDEGRIISSGHFRNEHGRVDAAVAAALADADGRVALVAARGAEREFLALAREEPVQVAGRTFTLIGGVAVDEKFLQRLARDPSVAVSLIYPGGSLSSDADGALDAEGSSEVDIREVQLRLIRPGEEASAGTATARLRITQSRAPIRALLRSVNGWFMATAAGTGAAALLLAVWVSSRISRPLSELADKTAVLDLDRLDIGFDEGTDEVGTLSRVLGDLADRLRTSTARVREAERRATVGDLARQINHDIKNGLIPIRNVTRHLAQVQRDDPRSLPAVLAERRQTLESSIAYLETLATNYERLAGQRVRRPCDLHAIIEDVVRGMRGQGHVEMRTRLAANLPSVAGDPVGFRRIVENLIANAVDSLEGKPGVVTVTTDVVQREHEPPAVRLTVEDTGRGMSKQESDRIFNDFYTTKAGGTGLGLSIVRRLVLDAGGAVRAESEPGVGTTMVVEIPAGGRGRST